jgi:hypothetical protein
MAVFAMSLSSINGGQRVAFSKRVLSWSSQPQMIVIDAPPVLARVIHHHAIRNVPILMPVGYSMGTPASLPKVKNTIAVLIQRRFNPQQTITNTTRLAQKTSQFTFSHSHEWHQRATRFIIAEAEVC